MRKNGCIGLDMMSSKSFKLFFTLNYFESTLFISEDLVFGFFFIIELTFSKVVDVDQQTRKAQDERANNVPEHQPIQRTV